MKKQSNGDRREGGSDPISPETYYLRGVTEVLPIDKGAAHMCQAFFSSTSLDLIKMFRWLNKKGDRYISSSLHFEN